MPNPTAYDLAETLVLGRLDLRDPHVCGAWIESADRTCGRPGRDWLCPRHVKVAQRVLDRRRAKDAIKADRARMAAESARPSRLAALARIEARLDAIDPMRRDARADGAIVNVPIAKRLPSDTRIAELARLHRERDRLRALLGRSA